MIDPDDRVTYAEAAAITGRSHRYLRQQAQLGHLTRDGGQRRDVYNTWLSRAECETLALTLYRRGHPTDYWVTMTEAAGILGIIRQHTHNARSNGQLPAQRTATGDWLLRRADVTALATTRTFQGWRPRT